MSLGKNASTTPFESSKVETEEGVGLSQRSKLYQPKRLQKIPTPRILIHPKRTLRTARLRLRGFTRSDMPEETEKD